MARYEVDCQDSGTVDVTHEATFSHVNEYGQDIYSCACDCDPSGAVYIERYTGEVVREIVSEEAAKLRKEAIAHEAKAAESFERCDTDGFVSQWADGISAQRKRAEADLIENGGMADFPALFHLDGTVASTHSAYGQWGQYWVLNDAAAERYGKRFYSPSKAMDEKRRDANDAKKGFHVGTIRCAARADIVANGTGLAGAATARVAVLPNVAALRAGEYVIVSA